MSDGKKFLIPLEYDSSPENDERQIRAEVLPGKRLRITLEHPHREIIVGLGQTLYGLLGQPRLQLDIGSLFGLGQGDARPQTHEDTT